MINNMPLENRVGQNIYEKVSKLYEEIVSKKLLQNCSRLDKKKIDIIFNEIKYDANRIRNYKH